jgi:signal transduction histidine kinase
MRQVSGETTDVSQARALIDRAVSGGRRITDAPEWPLAAAMLLGLIAAIEVLLRGGDSDVLPYAILFGLGATMPLALARIHLPASVLAVTAAALVAHATSVDELQLTGAGLVALVAGYYLLGLSRPLGVSVPMLLPFILYGITAPYFRAGVSGRPFAALLLSLAAGALVVGAALRIRAEMLRREAAERAIADTLLEHVARGERARIARELHDVVAHHISMISVQAETARLATPGMPADGAKQLLAIGDTARSALTEMRRLLGVLREDAGPEALTRRPQPGLEQLNELIDEAREHSTTSTRLIVRGRVVPLDPGVGLTAFRIVQEALTNARRHAPGAAVDVELDYAENALRLRVRDNGPGPPPENGPAAGHGLVGMRERAAMVGGALHTGPAPASGFQVEATLPTATQEAG